MKKEIFFEYIKLQEFENPTEMLLKIKGGYEPFDARFCVTIAAE